MERRPRKRADATLRAPQGRRSSANDRRTQRTTDGVRSIRESGQQRSRTQQHGSLRRQAIMPTRRFGTYHERLSKCSWDGACPGREGEPRKGTAWGSFGVYCDFSDSAKTINYRTIRAQPMADFLCRARNTSCSSSTITSVAAAPRSTNCPRSLSLLVHVHAAVPL